LFTKCKYKAFYIWKNLLAKCKKKISSRSYCIPLYLYDCEWLLCSYLSCKTYLLANPVSKSSAHATQYMPYQSYAYYCRAYCITLCFYCRRTLPCLDFGIAVLCSVKCRPTIDIAITPVLFCNLRLPKIYCLWVWCK